jgi:F-type H+-transporting ATPase subunit b
MRNRLLLTLGIVLLGLVGFTGHAAAQESGGEEPAVEGADISHAAEECITLLEEGGKDPEDCNEAPSPILPEGNELVWGALSFLIVFLALLKFGFPAIKKGLDDRKAKIQGDLDAAEAAKAEVTAKAEEYDAKLAEARTEAAHIIEEARQDADKYRADKRTEADAEIATMKEQAAADVEASKTQAVADIRGEVATLAIAAAEHVVGRSLDQDANLALVEQFIDSVGARGN